MRKPGLNLQCCTFLWMKRSVALTCIIGITFPAHSQNIKEETVFRKSLSTSQFLVVTRREVPYVPPTQAEVEKQLKQFDAGSRIVKPDHVWVYLMQLQNKTGSAAKTLWTTTALEYAGYSIGSLKIYDADYDGRSAVVVYNDSLFVQGEITRSANNFRVPTRTLKSVTSQQIVRQQLSSQQLQVTSAKISLSNSPQAVAVTLGDSANKTRRFVWRNKWVEQKPAQAAKKR